MLEQGGDATAAQEQLPASSVANNDINALFMWGFLVI